MNCAGSKENSGDKCPVRSTITVLIQCRGLKVISRFRVNDLLFVCFVQQKLAVRSCPVGTAAKPLALIKPPSQSIAISVVPAKTPVSMVTAHINGQKTLSSETLQTSPINLQTPAGQHINRSQVQQHDYTTQTYSYINTQHYTNICHSQAQLHDDAFYL